MAASADAKESTMHLSAPAFSSNAAIPTPFTCQGADRSPPLAWTDVPAGTKSLAIIVDDPDAPDPDAPKTTWVHWVLYNLPPETTALAEGMKASAMPKSSREGLNDWKAVGYRGPCPPIGRHRYFFKVYALNTVLPDLGKAATKATLEKAMHGHILGQAQLVGTYQK